MLSQLCALHLQIDLSFNSIGGHEEEDGYDSDENEKTKCVSDPTGVQAIADALGVNASLTRCNILGNKMDVASAKLLVDAVKDKDCSLAGITPDQTTANFYNHGLEPPDAILLASDLSKAGVSASLTEVC